MNKSVESYLIEGCGRCPLGGTPKCKVHKWLPELEYLRKLVLSSGLTETSKWGVPCYTLEDKNVLMISALNEYACISFFKGSLLNDDKKLLVKPGPNSQAARLLKFKNIDEIQKIENDIKAYILASIELEKAGIKVQFNKNPEPIPQELEAMFEKDPVLKNAFEALTPGRQRGYILYFSAPKQSETRVSRIKKSVSKILNGEGLHDKYSQNK